MSLCALMMVKDEADVIVYTLRHLAANVDEIVVLDNGSTDDTLDLMRAFAADERANMMIVPDSEVGYWQSVKMTTMAEAARARGHTWVLPCDADEFWYQPDGRPLADYLARIGPDVQIVAADLYNHLPTGEDDPEQPNPFRRLGWRMREPGTLPKVCCRTHPSLVIHAGNHGAEYATAALAVPGFVIRHFSWRSEQQYVKKIVNGARAYAATSLPDNIGAHWRMFGPDPDPEAVAAHYREWFFVPRPRERDDDLIYDPAPFVEEEP